MPKAQTTDWETPHDLFDKLWDEFGGFDLDPCCLPGHHSAQRVLAAGGTIMCPYPESLLTADRHVLMDGLAHPWHGKVYTNPPYGREMKDWIQKAVGEVIHMRAELVVALLPARTDTRWWQEYVIQYARLHHPTTNDDWLVEAHGYLSHVRFLPGRLRFVGAKSSAPFPSAIVVWRAG